MPTTMTKVNIALPDQMLNALAIIEKDTDRPRTRIIRHAINKMIKEYGDTHPGFFDKIGPVEVERILKPGLRLDTVMIGGKRQEVIVTEDGWRIPRADDYIEEQRSFQSLLDTE